MSSLTEGLFAELEVLIQHLGADGGLMSAAVYDTAQQLRFLPEPGSIGAVRDWLLDRQQPDGGWNDPVLPRFREVPTLAAVLALNADERPRSREAVKAALSFLKELPSLWDEPLPKSKPSGIELTLPRLYEEAVAAGLAVPPPDRYATLAARGRGSRKLMGWLVQVSRPLAALTWEAWGTEPEPALVDDEAGVGHGPAPTAKWLAHAEGRPGLEARGAIAREYLRLASRATGEGIPGVVPTAWPIPRYEQSFGLYTLIISDLFAHTALQGAVRNQIDDLAGAYGPSGIACADTFVLDGDDTAATLVVLSSAGRSVDSAAMRSFEKDDHFYTWPNHLQSSTSITARAVHALALMGEDVTRNRRYLVSIQEPDGRWTDDTWNTSWFYITCHVVCALEGDDGCREAISRAIDATLSHQHADGGWGLGAESTVLDTAWAVLTLYQALRHGEGRRDLRSALARAAAWMRGRFRPGELSSARRWIAKDLYTEPRVDRVTELCGMLVLERLEGANGQW